MILGWLLARDGIDVVVLEKHADFLRDFRGDTIHPSTLELMHELGVLDQLLALPHTRIDHLDLVILGERTPGPDFRDVPTHCKFLALMPQWDFLEFVRRQATPLSGFQLVMEAEATELVYDAGQVCGARATTPGGELEVRADLVIGADGRHSTIRERAKLPRTDLGAPIDVLWMRLSRRPSDPGPVFGMLTRNQWLVLLDRGSYWQCAYLIEKGSLATLKQRGLPAFRDDLCAVAPFLADRVDELRSWDDIKLLSVVVDRLDRWWAPGLLCIGDAAHAMSPVGGVGINLAIQDAVAAANVLAEPLRERAVTVEHLAAVQARRESFTKRTQALQVAFHDHVLAKVLAGGGQNTLRAMRFLLRHIGALRRAVARRVGVGKLEHVAA